VPIILRYEGNKVCGVRVKDSAFLHRIFARCGRCSFTEVDAMHVMSPSQILFNWYAGYLTPPIFFISTGILEGNT
jgi:hypothetical protein